MCFTDFVGDPLTRNLCGKVFIGILCIFAAVHMIFLLQNLCHQIIKLIRTRYYARRNRKLIEKAARENPYKEVVQKQLSPIQEEEEAKEEDPDVAAKPEEEKEEKLELSDEDDYILYPSAVQPTHVESKMKMQKTGNDEKNELDEILDDILDDDDNQR